MPLLSIIIVSWNVRDMLRGCLSAVEASFTAAPNLNNVCEVIVVDNASSDGTPEMVRAEFPRVWLIEAGHNSGFAAGNNMALLALLEREERERGSFPASVLLLNPDTEPQADAIPQLMHYLASHPEVVAVGPQLRYADGSVQSSRRRFPTRATFFWESTPLERLWPSNPWARRYHCADQEDNQEQRVEWLVGAALLVRGSGIVRAGLLDENFFIYSEELAWQALLTRATGGSIVYLPTAVVVHHEGRSSEQVPATRHIHFQRSKVRLAKLWYGWDFAVLLRVFLLICYAWELVVESAKYALGHKRDLRRERIVVYRQVLRGLLR